MKYLGLLMALVIMTTLCMATIVSAADIKLSTPAERAEWWPFGKGANPYVTDATVMATPIIEPKVITWYPNWMVYRATEVYGNQNQNAMLYPYAWKSTDINKSTDQFYWYKLPVGKNR